MFIRRFALATAALLTFAAVPPSQTDRGGEAPCHPVTVAVSVAPGAPTEHAVAGALCLSAGPTTTLQILLSGASYARWYWDPPYRPERYSYVQATRSSGVATLALDHLGVGGSTRPAATQLQVQTHAHVVEQVIEAARSGVLEGGPFERVVLVGHSLGSAVALVAASRSPEVDGLILTGLLPHATPTIGAPVMTSSLYPSQAESRFRDRPLGYLTTRPGTRGFFYQPAASEPEMVTVDEANKETLSLLEPNTVSDATEREVSESIRVPVLSVVGEFDNFFCATSCAGPDSPAFAEARHYPNVPCFRPEVVPGAGHVINLHLPAEHFFALAREWLSALSRGLACA